MRAKYTLCLETMDYKEIDKFAEKASINNISRVCIDIENDYYLLLVTGKGDTHKRTAVCETRSYIKYLSQALEKKEILYNECENLRLFKKDYDGKISGRKERIFSEED